LADRAGLLLKRTIQEADDGVFWASEAYLKDIPMNDPRFPYSSLISRILGLAGILEYRRRAAEINLRAEADQVCFEFVKADIAK
jgi:hypothetical protein